MTLRQQTPVIHFKVHQQPGSFTGTVQSANCKVDVCSVDSFKGDKVGVFNRTVDYKATVFANEKVPEEQEVPLFEPFTVCHLLPVYYGRVLGSDTPLELALIDAPIPEFLVLGLAQVSSYLILLALQRHLQPKDVPSAGVVNHRFLIPWNFGSKVIIGIELTQMVLSPQKHVDSASMESRRDHL